MATKAKELREHCEYIVRIYMPKDEKTYCNLAVNYVARKLGYEGFYNTKIRRIMMANAMVTHMKQSADWAEVWPSVVKKLADDGKLVIAGQFGDEHGHVAVACPGEKMVTSGNWRMDVPVMANVGKKNKIQGANWCFKMPPQYFVWVNDEYPKKTAK